MWHLLSPRRKRVGSILLLSVLIQLKSDGTGEKIVMHLNSGRKSQTGGLGLTEVTPPPHEPGVIDPFF